MTAPLPEPASPTDRSAGRILGLLAVAALLVNFIETMLVPALPRLSNFFDGAPYTTVAWILSAYLVVGVATIPLFGKLGDLYGKRRILTVVLSVYAFAVVLAPFTPGLATLLGLSRGNAVYLLIGVRGIQGVGLAMFPLALAMVAEALPKEQVAPAQGLIASMFAVGAALGLVGGSWLIEHFGWQMAYESVLAFAVALPFLAATVLPEGHRGTGGSLDVPGAALLAGTLGSFLVGLTLGPSWGWTALTGGSIGGVGFGVPELFLVALLLAGLFLWRERTAAEPIVDLRRLGDRNIALSYLGALLVGAALFVGFVVLTVLVEFPTVGLGLSVQDFGLFSIPTTVAMFVAAPLVGRAVARFGPRPMVLFGSGLATTGFLLLLGFHATYPELILEAVPTFVGLIAVLVSVTNVIAMSSHAGETGIHMGLTEMFQDLGASAGPVVVATFLATFTRTLTVPDPAAPGGSVATTIPSGTAFDVILAVGAAMTALMGVLGLFLTNYRVAHPVPDPGASPVPEAVPETPVARTVEA